jgi:hypothetical protein
MSEETSLGEPERAFFLGVYRSAVDFYQPRIEKKTGVLLGKIGIWDYSQLQLHEESSHRLIRALRRFLPRARREDPIAKNKAVYDEWASKCSASYYANGIYISFSSGTAHEEAIAAVVVHELAHALWERLATKPLSWMPRPKYREKYCLLVEGFATYAERVWFIDLYPVSVRHGIKQAQYDPKGIHYRGMRMVEALVQREGPQILFDIPKRWPILA